MTATTITMPIEYAEILHRSALALNEMFKALADPAAMSAAGIVGKMVELGLATIDTQANGGQHIVTLAEPYLKATVEVGEQLTPHYEAQIAAEEAAASTAEAPAQPPSGRLPAGESEGARP